MQSLYIVHLYSSLPRTADWKTLHYLIKTEIHDTFKKGNEYDYGDTEGEANDCPMYRKDNMSS